MKITVVLSFLLINFSCESGHENDRNYREGYPKAPVDNPEYIASLTSYENCEEIQSEISDYLSEKKERWEKYEDELKAWMEHHEYADSLEPNANAFSKAQEGNVQSDALSEESKVEESFTNVQESGIDEADRVKIGSKNIYSLRRNAVSVVQRKSLNFLGDLKIKGHAKLMYNYKDLVVVISEVRDPIDQSYFLSSFSSWHHPLNSTSIIEVFAEQDNTIPKLVKKFETKSSYVDSRLVKGQLVVVQNSRIPFLADNEEENDPFKKEILHSEEKIHGIPCNSISKRPFIDEDYSMAMVSSIDLNKSSFPKTSAAVLGSGTDVYMGPSSLYVTRKTYHYGEGEDQVNYQHSVITKIGFQKENFKPEVQARGRVKGTARNQYSYQEFSKDNVLALVTTTNRPMLSIDAPRVENKEIGRNHLWVLQANEKKLEVKTIVANFGEKHEDVRSVRFTDEKLYVVTFEKTDPLYSFDLSNPLNVQITGELKIPGFSSYLHPFGKSKLIGIGYDAKDMGDFSLFQGLQVSLFDVSDPSSMSRLANITLGDRGSSSEITHNAHAFYIDQESGVFAAPFTILNNPQQSGRMHTPELEFSGAIFFEVVGGGLEEKARISHNELIPNSCQNLDSKFVWWQNMESSMDVNRIYKVDERYLTVSRFGIKALDQDNPEVVSKVISFNVSKDFCERQNQRYTE